MKRYHSAPLRISLSNLFALRAWPNHKTFWRKQNNEGTNVCSKSLKISENLSFEIYFKMKKNKWLLILLPAYILTQTSDGVSIVSQLCSMSGIKIHWRKKKREALQRRITTEYSSGLILRFTSIPMVFQWTLFFIVVFFSLLLTLLAFIFFS